MESTIAKFIFAAAVLGTVSIPGVADAQGQAAAPARPKTNRDIIARADLDAKPSANLYDVVSSSRSQWLRGSASARANMSVAAGGFARNADSPANDPNMPTAGGYSIALVYLDGRSFGGLSSLRNLSAETAEKICYFNLNKAQGRFGLAVTAPVIEVFTRGSSYAESAC
ncbi:MAG: hypothetical protein ABIV11_08535 [Gemmatimonadaceae bacterium]